MPKQNYQELSGPELDAAMRKRIEVRINERNALYMHLMAFVGGNLIVWVIGLVTGSLQVIWPLFVTVPWAVALAIHAYVVYLNSGSAVERRNQEIKREVELEKIRLGLSSEKPKRSGAMRLSDDGELVSDDESDLKAKRDTISAK